MATAPVGTTTYVSMAGNTIDLAAAPNDVPEAKTLIAKLLGVWHAQVTLLVSGEQLADSDPLPSAGMVQVVGH